MAKAAPKNQKSTLRYEAVKIEPLFEVLDAVAFIDSPTTKDIAQYANIDGRTAGKLLKNARLIGLVQSPDDNTYVLSQPYPYKGTLDEKRMVVREALLRLPLIRNIRQLMALGNDLQNTMRKAATVVGEKNYNKAAIAPVVTWATSAQVLDLGVRVETLVNEAVATKEAPHAEHEHERLAFTSHSAKDKPFVRKLAAISSQTESRSGSMSSASWSVTPSPRRSRRAWPNRISSSSSVSQNSVASAWVKKELSSALVHEIERRKVTVLPIKLDDAQMPDSINDKLYADFTGSYDDGLNKLIQSIKAREAVTDGRSS